KPRIRSAALLASPVQRIFALVLALLAGLAGCSTESAPPQAEAAPDVPFEVLDIAERSLDGAPALAVLLSHPLRAERRYDDYLQVRDAEGTVAGAWVLSDNRRVLYFPQVRPETRYTVSVAAGL